MYNTKLLSSIIISVTHYHGEITPKITNEKRDIDVIREHHKFLWDDDEEPCSWEEQLAKKYYDKLYKEYCICDLSRYEEGKIALRWQIEAELVSGKGQFICANKVCSEKEELRTWEVNFGYIESGEKKNALVKLRLCEECSVKLNYKKQMKEVKKKKKKRPRKASSDDSKDEKDEMATANVKRRKSEEPDSQLKISESEETDSNIWKGANQITAERSREDDFEEFLEQLIF